MRLLMKCTHVIDVDVDKVTSPSCWCGEGQVARTLDAPRPRIRGHAQGPLVASTYLGPTPLDVTTDGPLPLQPDDTGDES